MSKEFCREEKKKIKELFKAKKLFHKEMAKIPFEEKIKIVVRLQNIVNELKTNKGRRKKRVWKI
ncbi:MAG TPA: hypothetical protein P5150_06025 [Candidatus Ratteibacteria bacterium]|nr:hypothetical protein [bacterium]HRR96270.1 hypothetical protein [Candidatus Ratteibacteria bacterium]